MATRPRSHSSHLAQANTPADRFWLESCGIFLISAAFIIVTHVCGAFDSLDRLIYDGVLARERAPQADDIVLVTIDEQSLDAMGPWPWSRIDQARLIERVGSFSPKLVALDIIYASYTPQSEPLIHAVGALKTNALPLMIDTLAHNEQHVEVLPFPELIEQADLLGHVQVEIEDDAIVRGVYLYQGVGTPEWPHLMEAVSAHLGAPPQPRCTTPDFTPLVANKCGYVRFPLAGPPGTYPQVSALDLLTASKHTRPVLARALKDKVILIGVTALGSGDWVASPLGSDSAPLSGVEFNANLLSALRLDTLIRSPPDWALVLIALVVIAISSFGLPRQRPIPAVLTSFAMAIVPILLSIAALSWFWIHLPLANATIASILIYPLWSWRRHEIAWNFISTELDRIAKEEERFPIATPLSERSDILQAVSSLLGRPIETTADTEDLSDAEQRLVAAALNPSPSGRGDNSPPIERLAAQISVLNNRAEALRAGREIGLAGLDRMSSAALILSALGEVHFFNDTAASLLDWRRDRDTLTQLASIPPPLGQSWRDIWRAAVLERRSVAFESHLPAAEAPLPIFVTAGPLRVDETEREDAFAEYWVITMTDLSEIREAEASREEALAFLSHDLRSPLTSILALINRTDSDDPVLEDIQRYTQKGLSTSEQFLQLSRLQLRQAFETYPIEAEQIIHNAIEQVYFLAQEKGIKISTRIDELESEGDGLDGYWMDGNGELLERAFVNLLGNAIKYSQRGSAVVVALTRNRSDLLASIADQGYGIPEEELPYLFEPFFRSSRPELAAQRGSGLGLRFVKTVIERHGGGISVESEESVGTTFEIRLPLLADLEDT